MGIDFHPFGLGPWGAAFLTCFVCCTVLGVSWMFTTTTRQCVDKICDAISDMWVELREIIRGK